MDLMPLSALILQSIPETIIVLIAGLALSGLEIKKNTKKLIAIGILNGLSSYFIRSLPIPFGVHTLLHLPLLMVLLKYFLNISFKQGILVIMLGSLVQIIIEIIYVPVAALLLNMPISEIIKDPILRILVPWPYLLIMLGMSFYFKRKNITIFPLINILGTKFFNVRYSLIALVLIQAILLGLINTNLLLEKNDYSLSKDLVTTVHIYSAVILLSLLLSLFLVRKLLASVKREIAAESQNLFLKNVNDLFVNLKAQRHDFINHVHTLNGLLSLSNYELAGQYAKKLVQETVQLNDVIRLKEPFLAALLRSKLAYADARSIQLTVTSDTTLDKFKLDSFELTRIIGNLVDNAVEAVERLPQEERKVEVAIKQYSDFYIFEISNSGPPIPKEQLKAIYTPEFTTKTGHSGLGLTIVKQLTEKNKGSLGIKSEPGSTVFTIVLPIT